MIRAIPFVLLILVAATFTAPPVAAQSLLDLARPDVNVLAGIRVADFASSPLVSMFWDQARAQQPGFDQLLSVMGPNPLSMIDEVVIGASVDGSPTEDEGFVLASGRFDETLVVSALCPKGCETTLYEGFEVRRPLGDSEDKHFVIMDGSRIALGNLAEIQGVVARRLAGSPSRFGAGMSDWIQRLGGHHIWIAAAGPFPQPELDADNAFAQMLGNFGSKIDGFGVGIDVTEDIDLNFDVRAATQQDAQQFYDLLNGFIAMAKANEQTPETLETLNKIQLTHDGNVLAASIRVTGEEIRRQMAARVASGGSGVAAAERVPSAPPSSRPNVVVQPAPKRRSGGIRIFGLGEEAVEIPTTKGKE